MIVANYYTDLNELVGLYPMKVNEDSIQILPDAIQQLYLTISNFEDCRVSSLIPRKIKLQINTNNTLEIELPVRPTIAQLQSIKNNSNAITIETIGEKIDYTRLRYLI